MPVMGYILEKIQILLWEFQLFKKGREVDGIEKT